MTKQIKKISTVFIVASILLSIPAYAVKFKVSKKDVTVSDFVNTATASSETQAAIQKKIDSLPELFSKLTTEVNDKFKTTAVEDFFDSEANAASVVGKAVHTDTASDLELFTIGVGAGLGLSGNNVFSPDSYDANNSLPSAGFSPQGSFTIGLNAYMLGLPKKIFANKIRTKRLFLYLNSSYLNFAKFPGKDDLSLKFYDFGLQAQYKIIPSVYIAKFKLLTWTGVNVSTGLTMSSIDVGIDQTVDLDRTKVIEDTLPDGSKATSKATLYYQSEPGFKLGIKNRVYSMPFEVSTGIQMLYFWTLYTGVGIDLNIGSSSSLGDMNGNFTMEVSEAKGTKVAAGTGLLSLGDGQSSPYANMRFFLGNQFNISLLKIFVQGTYALSSAFALDFGVRVAY